MTIVLSCLLLAAVAHILVFPTHKDFIKQPMHIPQTSRWFYARHVSFLQLFLQFCFHFYKLLLKRIFIQSHGLSLWTVSSLVQMPFNLKCFVLIPYLRCGTLFYVAEGFVDRQNFTPYINIVWKFLEMHSLG